MQRLPEQERRSFRNKEAKRLFEVCHSLASRGMDVVFDDLLIVLECLLPPDELSVYWYWDIPAMFMHENKRKRFIVKCLIF